MIILLTLLIIIIAVAAIGIPTRILGLRMLRGIFNETDPGEIAFAFITAMVLVICIYALIVVVIYGCYSLAGWILTLIM